MNDHTETSAIPSWRIRMVYVMMASILLIFAARLYFLQVVDAEAYRLEADENRFSRVSIPAPRGVIYDRNGFLLVRNLPSFNIMVTPALLPDSPAEVELIYRRLADLTGVPLDQEGPAAPRCEPGRGIRQLAEEGAGLAPYQAWPVACDVQESTARIVREAQQDLPGVSVEADPIRDYTMGDLTAAVIGYLGPIPETLQKQYEDQGFVAGRDKIGYAGVESWFQEMLAGRNGQKLVERDVAGQTLREVGTVNQPLPGQSLRLTIDTRLQAAARAALRNRMDFINRYAGETRTPLGVAIAMNPQTGEILAMVTLPTYENNRLARYIPTDYYEQLLADDRGKPLINHAISGEFPPGSTFKIVTGTGALNEGVIKPTDLINDPGKITIANRYFPNDPGKAQDFVCWKKEGHGRLSFVQALAFSCNIYFYKIGGGYPGEVAGDGLGIDRIGIYARALGYGAPLGIDLPAEENGLIPSEDWKRINLGESWSTGDTYNSATGQGFVMATPLQVLTSVSTIANGGKVIWPHVTQAVLDGEGNVVQTFEPRVLWNIADDVITPDTPDIVVDPAVIAKVREGMLHVVTEGTASGYANLETISSGGKTGTGEFCDAAAEEKGLCIPGNWPTHSWYVGFAPWENPEIAVVAFVYNGGEGAITSGPIVRQILEAYFTLKAVDAARETP